MNSKRLWTGVSIVLLVIAMGRISTWPAATKSASNEPEQNLDASAGSMLTQSSWEKQLVQAMVSTVIPSGVSQGITITTTAPDQSFLEAPSAIFVETFVLAACRRGNLVSFLPAQPH